MSITIRSVLLGLLSVGIVTAAAVMNKPGSHLPDEKISALQETQSRYWKGNLHTHSLWSDGDDFPEMIADWYKRHNYDFLSLTDHNVLSQGTRWVNTSGKSVAMKKYLQRFGDGWVESRNQKGVSQVRLKPLAEFRSLLDEPGKFLLIPGEEITHRYARLPVHMNAINLRDVIKPIDGDNVTETIRVNQRAVLEQESKLKRPMFSFLNHPNFGWGVRAEDMITAQELQFFEVHNGHPAVGNYGDKQHPSCERLWDIVLAQRLGNYRLPVIYGVATDDAHRYHQWGVGKVNPGRAWVMVKAPYLTAEAIVKAMKKGDFYSTTGVTLKDVQLSDNQLTITIQPEKGVTYKTEFIATMKDAPLTSKPRLDEQGKDLKVTRVYSEKVGKVVSTVTGAKATYQLTGNELYVRAKITSSKPHPNPYEEGDVELAWTQPVRPK